MTESAEPKTQPKEPRKLGLACKEVQVTCGIIARDYPEAAAAIRTELRLKFGNTRAVERIGILLITPETAAPKSSDTPVAASVAFINNPNTNPHPEWKPGTKLRSKGSTTGNVWVATSGAFISPKGAHEWRIRYRDQDGLMEREQWAYVSKLEEVPEDVAEATPHMTANGTADRAHAMVEKKLATQP